MVTKGLCPTCRRRSYFFCPYCLIIFHKGHIILNSLAVTYLAAALLILFSFICKMYLIGFFGDFTILYNRNFVVPGSPVFIEYPFIIWGIVQLCQDTNHTMFVIKNSMVVASCLFLSIYFLHKIEGRLNQNTLTYFVVTLSVFNYVLYNWDMVAVFFTLASLFFFIKEKFTFGGFFLALGTFTKVYPIFLILPTIYFYRRKILKVVIPFNLFLLTLAALYILTVKDWYAMFLFHWLRFPNIDSVGGVILEAVGLLGGDIDEAWQPLSLLFNVALCLLPFLIYVYRDASLSSLWSVTLCAVLLTSKVYSPQYNLWVLPFFALAPVNKIAFYIFELSNLVITLDYSRVVQTPLILFTTILARHIALILVTIKFPFRVNKERRSNSS